MVSACAALVLSCLPFVQDPAIEAEKYGLWTPKSDVGNFLIGPTYADAPELASKGAPEGKILRFVMRSEESKIYPGIAKNQTGTVPYKRNVTVYVPAQYEVGRPAPFLISQDSLGKDILPAILDRMIAQKRLPVMVAIMIDSGGGDAQGSQRGLEYDTLSGTYADFVETEVLPKARLISGVTFSKDPDARMTMGGSSGGACAFSMAWYRPNLYHRVLSYSGTFVNQQWPENPQTPHGAWEYHEHLIAREKRKPLRIWMHVGENDIRSHDEASTYHNWPMANERMAQQLAAKHYPYQFVYARNSGHVDGKVVRQTLPAALEWVWRGYPR